MLRYEIEQKAEVIKFDRNWDTMAIRWQDMQWNLANSGIPAIQGKTVFHRVLTEWSNSDDDIVGYKTVTQLKNQIHTNDLVLWPAKLASSSAKGPDKWIVKVTSAVAAGMYLFNNSTPFLWLFAVVFPFTVFSANS